MKVWLFSQLCLSKNSEVSAFLVNFLANRQLFPISPEA